MEGHACSNCPNTDKCREVWAEENRGPLSPGGLAISSVIAFLFPLAVAILAGAVGKTMKVTENMVILYSLVGLIIGAGVAAVLVKVIKKRFASNPDSCSAISSSAFEDYLGSDNQ